MTDRELLELAAKAAGMWKTDFSLNDDCLPDFHEEKGFRLAMGKGWWNPLIDDGDAMRLAVSLGIDLLFTPGDVKAFAAQHVYEDHQEMITPWAWESIKAKDPYAATRRAIVRTAAEIGKQMGGSNDIRK